MWTNILKKQNYEKIRNLQIGMTVEWNGQLRPNKIPKKYERKVNRLLWILDLWERWANRV